MRARSEEWGRFWDGLLPLGCSQLATRYHLSRNCWHKYWEGLNVASRTHGDTYGDTDLRGAVTACYTVRCGGGTGNSSPPISTMLTQGPVERWGRVGAEGSAGHRDDGIQAQSYRVFRLLRCSRRRKPLTKGRRTLLEHPGDLRRIQTPSEHCAPAVIEVQEPVDICGFRQHEEIPILKCTEEGDHGARNE